MADYAPPFDRSLGRCPWAGADGSSPDLLMVAYHDAEWGVPVDDGTELFERLALESFQAGLSWSTILHKRESFRVAFDGFVPARVARFGILDRERLLTDARIVRNRAKIDATIRNASRFLDIVAERASFAAYLASQVPGPPLPVARGTTQEDLPPRTAASDALSADLRGRGFSFVGSTIVYAFMQSVGLVDDHLPGCFRYRG
jgi:DNA-3-methyladenine glycosylase I